MNRKRSKLKAMEGLNDDAKILVTKKDIPIIVEAFLIGIRASSEDEDKYKSKVDSSIDEDSGSDSEEDSSEADDDEGENGFKNNDDLVMQNEVKSEVASSINEDSDSNWEEDSSDEEGDDQGEDDFETDESDDLVMQSEVKSEWPFFFVIAIDLGMEADGIKRMKSGLLAGTLASDAAGLSEMLLCWINNGGKEGNKEATWDNLISVISSNITLFPGHAKKDYVGILKQLHPGMTENNETESVMAAFNNDLIRDEILKYLPFEEKQHLRRLSRSFNELMLADWRKKLSAFCIGTLENGDNNACKFQDFYEFYEGNEALKLEEYPHRAVRIINEDIVLYGSRFLKMQKFWDHFAENLTALEFKSCRFEEGENFLNTFMWILLKACPNLESLKFTCICNAILDVDDVEDLDEEKEKRAEEVFFAGKIATNLKYFEVDVDPLSDAETQRLLEYTPCVETLSLCNVGLLEGLLKPRSSDEPFKLHTLTMYPNQESFLPLQRLTAQYPNSIKHLSILDLDFSIVRLPNIGPAFYLGIGQCQALCSLKLTFLETNTLRIPWLIELSTMEFPQLKTLHICFENENEVQRFDFAALKGMPQLKTLSIVYKKPVEWSLRIQEMGGIEDWVYDGPLEPSFLNKSNIFKEHSADSSIKLECLEEFEFFGWDITKQDVSLFSEWFPDLRILKTGITWPCKLPLFFPKLEMLVLRNDNDLRGLMNLRLIMKNARFVVQSNENSENRVELKIGDNHMVYCEDYYLHHG